MTSTSTQHQLLAKLARRSQWRITSTQLSHNLQQQTSIPRQCSASARPGQQSLRGFSTSPRLAQEHRIPPHTTTTAAAAASPTSPPAGPSSQPPPQPPAAPRRRRLGRWVSAIFLLLLGATSGTGLRAVLAPPPPLIPGTEVDDALAGDIREAASHLPVVRRLNADPDWSAGQHEAYEGIADAASRPRRITTGALAGTRGVGGYQHVWHNAQTGEAVAVIYFGTGTIGWPGVVHGGVIATILDEHSARAAVRGFGAGGKGPLTANLDITYKSPTLSSDFYIVRANAVPEEALAPEERGKRARKVWVDARIETVEGRVCVESRALFVSPKGVDLKAIPDNF